MNNLTEDSIAIDANVFEHLLNPKQNHDNHITILLGQLRRDQIRLLVDDKKRIVKEYGQRLINYMNKTAGDNPNRILLAYWFSRDNMEVVCVAANDKLMTAIKDIILVKSGKAVTDRFYVYVAFKKGGILVTNDNEDILKNREELKRKTKNFCPRGRDIMTSQQAWDGLTTDTG